MCVVPCTCAVSRVFFSGVGAPRALSPCGEEDSHPPKAQSRLVVRGNFTPRQSTASWPLVSPIRFSSIFTHAHTLWLRVHFCARFSFSVHSLFSLFLRFEFCSYLYSFSCFFLSCAGSVFFLFSHYIVSSVVAILSVRRHKPFPDLSRMYS